MPCQYFVRHCVQVVSLSAEEHLCTGFANIHWPKYLGNYWSQSLLGPFDKFPQSVFVIASALALNVIEAVLKTCRSFHKIFENSVQPGKVCQSYCTRDAVLTDWSVFLCEEVEVCQGCHRFGYRVSTWVVRLLKSRKKVSWIHYYWLTFKEKKENWDCISVCGTWKETNNRVEWM